MMKPMEPMQPMKPMEPMKPMQSIGHDKADRWWPAELGDSPDSAGGQNEMRYAYFGGKHRLAIDEGDGKIAVYDTDGHEVSGVRQRQSDGSKKIVFTGERGELDLTSLRRV